jgi:thioredoxin-related protein
MNNEVRIRKHHEMKKQNLILILIISFALYHPCSLTAQEKQKSTGKEVAVKWYSFEDAYKLNKKKPKKTFIDVYTEWCGWCKKMDAETFANPVIAKYMNDHFYCVKLDAERKDTIVLDGKTFVNPNPNSKRSTHQLAVDLLRGQLSYPSYVFLNEKGQMITVLPGYHQAKEFEAMLSFFGEDVYQNLTQDEFQSKFTEYTTNFQGKIK